MFCYPKAQWSNEVAAVCHLWTEKWNESGFRSVTNCVSITEPVFLCIKCTDVSKYYEGGKWIFSSKNISLVRPTPQFEKPHSDFSWKRIDEFFIPLDEKVHYLWQTGRQVAKFVDYSGGQRIGNKIYRNVLKANCTTYGTTPFSPVIYL